MSFQVSLSMYILGTTGPPVGAEAGREGGGRSWSMPESKKGMVKRLW